jgi:sarcosine oxidase subunit beta
VTRPRYDLAVIGAGLTGMSVALEARERGMSVVILEAETCARHASSASAGGVRSLNRHPSEIALVRAALPLWEGLAAHLGNDCGFKRSGQIRVAEDAAAMQLLDARAAATAALGYDHERLVTRAELKTRIPAISEHCVGALAVDDDGFADPLATSHAWRMANVRAGVRLLERTRVTAIDRTAGGIVLSTTGDPVEAEFVVNAAGAWGGRIAGLAGEALPLRAAALQMTVTAPLPAFVTPVLGTQGRKLSLKQSATGSVVIGGGYEGDVAEGPDGPQKGSPRPGLAAQNLANAVALFPALRTARVTRIWAGLEGMTPDDLPNLGAGTMPGLVHAFGFSGHGFALAPLVGPIVVSLLEGKRVNHAITPFAPSRFAPSRFAPSRFAPNVGSDGT